jgi:type IV secretion system protein VirB11
MSDSTALTLTLQSLRPWLDDPTLTELCINRPHEAFIERNTGWERVELPFADFRWCYGLAKLIANSTHQRIDESSPILSATLPTGERVQIALPPATTDGTVALTLRRPANHVWTLQQLTSRGLFHRTRVGSSMANGTDDQPQQLPTCKPDPFSHSDPTNNPLRHLLTDQRFEDFLRLAVRARKNILVSGPTGSGKTTFTKALILEIPPDERLITIEDTRELNLDHHPNHVRLYYSKDGQGTAPVTPKQLLEATLRMKPDRVLLAELRGEEAFYYLRNINSGHPGSITSIHAASTTLAFEQLVLLVKESVAGRELARTDILELLHQVIDVIVQFAVDGHHRQIRDIWFRNDSAE